LDTSARVSAAVGITLSDVSAPILAVPDVSMAVLAVLDVAGVVPADLHVKSLF
jgi:hypothetical protein